MPPHIVVASDKPTMGLMAAQYGAAKINAAIAARGSASVIVATGASQFDTLSALVGLPVDWSRVTCFHLDEYVGLPEDHPASFRKYLRERFVELLAVAPKAFHYVNTDGPGGAEAECARLKELINAEPVDVCFLGIGENAHLAFNDPPADMKTEEAYIVVGLDKACRKQQLGEGWFPDLDSVPKQAVSMTMHQMLKSAHIVASVPDARKARAVKASFEARKPTPKIPGSFLQDHTSTYVFLDTNSASKIYKSVLKPAKKAKKAAKKAKKAAKKSGAKKAKGKKARKM